MNTQIQEGPPHSPPTGEPRSFLSFPSPKSTPSAHGVLCSHLHHTGGVLSSFLLTSPNSPLRLICLVSEHFIDTYKILNDQLVLYSSQPTFGDVIDACVLWTPSTWDSVILLTKNQKLTLLTFSQTDTFIGFVLHQSIDLAPHPQASPCFYSRLQACPSASYCCIAGFEAHLLLYHLTESFHLELFHSLPIQGFLWSFDFLTCHSLLLGLAQSHSVSSTTSTPHRNSIVRVEINPHTKSISSHVVYRFGRTQVLGQTILTLSPSHALLIEEERLVVLDLQHSPAPIASKPLPSWGESQGAEHRMAGPNPLITCTAWASSNRLLLCFESGDVFWLQLGTPLGTSVLLSHLGLANPTKTCCVVPFAGEASSPVDILCMPGDNCDGLLAALDWKAVLSPHSNICFFRLQQIPSFAPILDMKLIATSKYVLGCGLGKHGTLRLVQLGTPAQILVATPPEYRGLTKLFALTSPTRPSLFVFSFVGSTRVLALVQDDLEDISGESQFLLHVATLATKYTLDDTVLVQVYDEGCLVLDLSHSCTLHYKSSTRIDHSVIQDEFIVLSGSQGHIETLTLERNPHTHQLDWTTHSIPSLTLENDISCMHLVTYSSLPLLFVATHSGQFHCYVLSSSRNWSSLSQFALSSLLPSESFCTPFAEDIQFFQLPFLSYAFLFIGLRTGHLLRLPFHFFPSELSCQVNTSCAHFWHLGVRAVHLTRLPGTPARLVAISDQPWLIQSAPSIRWMRMDPIVMDSVTKAPITHAVPFVSPSCPSNGILAIVAGSACILECPGRLQFQSRVLVGLEKTIRRVWYHPSTNVISVICSDFLASSIVCTLEFIDATHGTQLTRYEFQPNEVGLTLHQYQEYLIVGTTCAPSVRRSHKGRILLFELEPRSEPTASLSVKLVSQCTVPGAVYALSMYETDFIVASAGNRVFVLQVEPQLHIRAYAQTTCRNFVTAVGTQTNRIIIGDERDGILVYSFDRQKKQLHLVRNEALPKLISRALFCTKDFIFTGDKMGGLTVYDRAGYHHQINVFGMVSSFGEGAQGKILVSTLNGSLIQLNPLEYSVFEKLETYQQELQGQTSKGIRSRLLCGEGIETYSAVEQFPQTYDQKSLVLDASYIKLVAHTTGCQAQKVVPNSRYTASIGDLLE